MTTTAQETPSLLSPADVEEWIGINRGTLAQWRYKGLGPRFIKTGRRVKYSPEAIEAWLDENTRTQTGDAA